MEATQFDPYVDLEIIDAFNKQLSTKIQMIPTPMPLYRCYFSENDIIVTYLTHLLRGEYEIFQQITRHAATLTNPIRMYVLTDNKVIQKGSIDVHNLAHLLFRFHHRIAKKYIGEEQFLY